MTDTFEKILDRFISDWKKDHPSTGQIIFACTDNRDYANISTWTFDDDVNAKLLASGYRTAFLSSLDKIIPARIKAGLLPNDGGVIEFTEFGINISWLACEDALKLRDEVWER